MESGNTKTPITQNHTHWVGHLPLGVQHEHCLGGPCVQTFTTEDALSRHLAPNLLQIIKSLTKSWHSLHWFSQRHSRTQVLCACWVRCDVSSARTVLFTFCVMHRDSAKRQKRAKKKKLKTKYPLWLEVRIFVKTKWLKNKHRVVALYQITIIIIMIITINSIITILPGKVQVTQHTVMTTTQMVVIEHLTSVSEWVCRV